MHSLKLVFAVFCFNSWIVDERTTLRYLLFILSFLLCAELKAQSPLDEPFLQVGAVDDQFNIINLELYNGLVKVINHNFSNIKPNQSDDLTNISRIRLTSNGLLLVSDLKGIESAEDLREKFDENKYKNLTKNNICSKSDLFESEVFKKTTRGNIVYQLNNAKGEFLKSFTMNYKECL
jgi:hypothetical protein